MNEQNEMNDTGHFPNPGRDTSFVKEGSPAVASPGNDASRRHLMASGAGDPRGHSEPFRLFPEGW